MHPQISDSQPSIGGEELRRLEAALGFRLPADYAQFLLSHNGGRTSPAAFALRWTNASLARRFPHDNVHMLFAAAPGEPGDLASVFESYRERIPAGTLPIGIDPGGNLILLGLEAPHSGRVMLWVQDHEVDWEAGETPDFSNVGQAAASFTDFLAGLHEP